MAQGRRGRDASERSRARRAQEEARLATRHAFAGDLHSARRIVEQAQGIEHIVWLRAYVRCATGDLAGALALALPLARTAEDPLFRARAAVTAGSALRQLSRHAEAQDLERSALSLGTERAHLLIGLAADAVGLGDPGACARRLHQARDAMPARDPRARIRLEWVRCEHALMKADPAGGAAFARAALKRSRIAGYRRHVAKSWLFLGVALSEAGLRSGDDALRNARDEATAIGAEPVAEVARRLLGGPAGR